MTARFLRVELRRSSVPVIALLSVVAGTALLLSSTEGFAARWMQLAVSTRFLLTVLWPLALAGGAWVGQRDARSRVGELFASTVRPRWHRLLPLAGALAVAVVAAYAVVFLVGTAWVVPGAGYFPVGPVVIVATVGGLSLPAAGWLGMAAGRAVPRLVTPPALAVAGIALVGLLPDWMAASSFVSGRSVPPALLLAPVFPAGLDDFETVVTRVSVLQALWLVALAVTAVLLLSAVRRRAVALATLPAVLGAAVTVPLLPDDGYAGAIAVDPAAVEFVCDDDGPQVCVTRVHAGLLPEAVGPAREALTLLAAKLPDPPTRAVESRQVAPWAWSGRTPTRHPADTLVFDTPETVLEDAWWQECGERPVDTDTLLGRAVGAAWLSGRPVQPRGWWTPEDRERADRAYRTLIDLPEDEQARRMAAARAAVRDCRPDAFASILPEPSS